MLVISVNRFYQWSRDIKEGVDQGQVHAAAVRLGVLSVLAPLLSHCGALYHGRLRRPVHHPLHRCQHHVHGHWPLRHGQGLGRHPRHWKLCKWRLFSLSTCNKGTLFPHCWKIKCCVRVETFAVCKSLKLFESIEQMQNARLEKQLSGWAQSASVHRLVSLQKICLCFACFNITRNSQWSFLCRCSPRFSPLKLCSK